jgi:hypothetical protein
MISAPDQQASVGSTLPPLSVSSVGTRANLILLSGLDGNKNHPGDTFQAAVAEPVKLPGGGELCAGVLFYGKVARSQPSRILRRGGNLHISFTRMVLPSGESQEISSYLSQVELDESQEASLSSEGTVFDGPLGWKATLYRSRALIHGREDH